MNNFITAILVSRITSYNVCYTKLLRYPNPEITVLPRLLQQNGYEVIGYGKVAHDKMNFTLGFDAYSAPRVNLADSVKMYFGRTQSTKPLCLCVGDHRPHVPWTNNPTYLPKDVTLPSVITSYSIHYTKLYEFC